MEIEPLTRSTIQISLSVVRRMSLFVSVREGGGDGSSRLVAIQTKQSSWSLSTTEPIRAAGEQPENLLEDVPFQSRRNPAFMLGKCNQVLRFASSSVVVSVKDILRASATYKSRTGCRNWL
jgi:hypothetical protein